MGSPWIGVDLDGTLAVSHASGAFDPDIVGEPVEMMCNTVRAWLMEGKRIKIFTARVYSDGSPRQREDARRSVISIDKFCIEQFGQMLEITCVKDRDMTVLYDDRAIQVERNTGRIIG